MVRARGNLTYRLRRLPNYLERSTVANFLVNSVDGLGPPENILIFSLASNLVPWERPPTKTATLMFKKTPERFDNDQTEWTVSVPEQGQSLIFDTHFLEFTPLSDCDRDIHEFDCIAISGLASHPLGSWMHRKSQSNFVWLRDRLPKDMPGIRPIIYGYDTQLVQSESVQTIDDLASSFIARLASIGKAYTSAKPLIVIVHSLGGILLKSALVQMASSLGEGSILSSIKMIIFFGVPSRGMHMSHLLPMVKGQPNEHLIQLLSPNSDYLSSLNRHFSGIATLREIRLISAYETKLSRTTQVTEAGTWERTGPYELLVDKQSAIQADADPKNCFPINEDHSDMVKFADDSPEYRIVIGFFDTLIQAVRPDPTALLESQQFRSSKERASVAPSQTGRSKRPRFLNVMASASTAGLSYQPATQIQPESSKQPRRRGRKSAMNTEISSREANLQRERMEKQNNLKELRGSLDFAERSHRYDKITQPHQTTFNWIFENSDLGLVQWLRKGSGIYWIQGKPGSGKSTLMKFLHDSPRTSEILTRWRQGRGQMSAWFFFNERGSYIEKSFEGLFRSIIRELISANEQLAELVLEVYLDRVKQTSKQKQKQTWHVQDLEYALSVILSQQQQELDVLLFLDALDEYSGPPEMIAEFVQSLVQTTTDSKTKLKVLFSSRPWDAFVASFGRCPGFKMHEQTEGDMRVFVLDQLNAIPTATPSLSPPSASADSPPRDIVSTIVDRAEGVFLWVKLVTESLVEAGPNATTLQLERLLQALPDGLEELYERTIERIPGSSRLEVFIVIEIVNRTTEPMTVLDVVLAASCALGKTFQECVDATRKRLSGMDFQQEALRLKNLCGGLIDAGHSSADSTVQFMHQTVKDFVNRPGFEHRMLGCSRAPLYQNGFSFLFKYELAMLHIAQSSLQDHLPPGIPLRQAGRGLDSGLNIVYKMPNLARLAERTTGSNQETFLDSIGDSSIRSLFGSVDINSRSFREFFPYRSIVPDSVLSFAVYGDLLLYMRQKLQNTDIFKDSPRSSLLHIAVETSISPELHHYAPGIIELLLNNRANIHHMLGGETPFQHLMNRLKRHHVVDYPHDYWSRVSKVVEVFLKHGQDVNVDIPHSPSESLGGTSEKFSKALHIARNEVSKTLLEHGAHVNALDSDGLTALDHLIRVTPKLPNDPDYLPKQLGEMLCITGSILLEHGGCITHSTENLLPDVLDRLDKNGIDIPEALRNPPRLQGWLERRLRGLVPTFLGGK